MTFSLKHIWMEKRPPVAKDGNSLATPAALVLTLCVFLLVLLSSPALKISFPALGISPASNPPSLLTGLVTSATTSAGIVNNPPTMGVVSVSPSSITLSPGPSNTTVFCYANVTDINTAADVSSANGIFYFLNSVPNFSYSHFGVSNFSLGSFNGTYLNDSASVFTGFFPNNNSFSGVGQYFSQIVVMNRSNANQSLMQANWSWFESAGLTKDANGLGNDTVVLDLHFENDTKDASRFNNSGAVVNNNTGAMWTSRCQVGGCLTFDGGDDNVALPEPPVTSTNINTGSVFAWIKTTNAGTSYRGIVVKQGAYGMFLNSNLFGIYDWGNSADRSTGINLANGDWHFVGLTFSNIDAAAPSNNAKLYIDGALNLTTTLKLSYSTEGIVVGAGNNPGTAQFFNGLIDEVHIFNRSLSASEVNQLYSWEYNSTGKGNGGFINNFTNVSLAFRAKNYSFNDSGLVGWWDLGDSSSNESVTNKTLDLSGNGITGALVGGVTLNTTTCAVGNCLKLDGTGGLVNLGTPGSLEGLQTNLTISTWFNPSNPSSGLQPLYAVYLSVAGGNLVSLIRLDTGTLVYYTSNSVCGIQSVSSSISPSANVWHHLAVAINGSLSASTITFYFDGNAPVVGALAAMCTTPSLTIPVYIGGDAATSNERFNGSIDDIKIWNRTLSASEITALYNAGNPTNSTGQEGNWSAFTSEYYGGNASVSNVVGKLVQYRASLNSSGGSNYSAFLQNVTLNLGTGVVGMNLLNSSCSLQGASGNNVTANCSFALPYYFTAGLAWCAVNATDASGAFSNYTSNAVVNSLLALSASPSSINYGSIDPGSNSSAQAVNVTNFGNVALDAKFESTNLTSSGLADINASNQWYSFSTLGTGSDYRQVPNSTSAFNTTYNLGPSASGATSNATQYFIIAMDSGVRAGAYSGVLTITAAAH